MNASAELIKLLDSGVFILPSSLVDVFSLGKSEKVSLVYDVEVFSKLQPIIYIIKHYVEREKADRSVVIWRIKTMRRGRRFATQIRNMVKKTIKKICVEIFLELKRMNLPLKNKYLNEFGEGWATENEAAIVRILNATLRYCAEKSETELENIVTPPLLRSILRTVEQSCTFGELILSPADNLCDMIDEKLTSELKSKSRLKEAEELLELYRILKGGTDKFYFTCHLFINGVKSSGAQIDRVEDGLLETEAQKQAQILG